MYIGICSESVYGYVHAIVLDNLTHKIIYGTLKLIVLVTNSSVELTFRILFTYYPTKGNCCLGFSDEYWLNAKFARAV